MLEHYSKFCVEALIVPALLSGVLEAIASLRKTHDPILADTLDRAGGSAVANSNSLEELTSWFDAYSSGVVVLDAVLRRDPQDFVAVVTLKDVRGLETAWGKRQKDKRGAYVILHCFGTNGELGEHAQQVCNSFAAALRRPLKRKTSPKTVSISTLNQTFTELKKKPHDTPELTNELEELLTRVRSQASRDVLLRTRQAKDPTLKNVAKSAGISEAKGRAQVRSLLVGGLLERQVAIKCLGCSHQIARVSSETALGEMVDRGVSCPNCNRLLNRKSFEYCYFVAESVGPLLDGSKWMGLLLRSALGPYFGSGSRVRTEVIDGPNELDLVANLDGELLLMELKDARFSIGHAYSFVGKCSQYKPEVAAIVASGGVDPDVKQYIENTGLRAHYFESLDTIEKDLRDAFAGLNAERLSRLMGQISWEFSVSRSLLGRFGHSIPMPARHSQVRRYMSTARGRLVD